ncbi:MAG: hypothetical protein ACAI35_27515, partial [Candidatus Methylacidiphilales bacterium]
ATIQYNSPPHYQTSYTASIIQSLPYSFVTLFCGWWGFPWGPVYTLSALGINLTGGKNLTNEFLNDLCRKAAASQPEGNSAGPASVQPY